MDFRGHQRTSLRRRTALRMEHQHLEKFTDYHDFLEVHPQEFVELLNTVLINVTPFFRDSDAWHALKTAVLPHLTAPGRNRDMLRFWSIGCASGEEPHPLAMLLCEAIGVTENAKATEVTEAHDMK